MTKKITVYTTDTCAYCGMVKKWLKSKNINFDEVNIDQHPERSKEAIAASGQMTVPITIITKQDDSQEVVVGFNLSKLAPAVS